MERGNVDGFAKLLDYHWELSKKVDAGSSNTLIEQIFSSIEVGIECEPIRVDDYTGKKMTFFHDPDGLPLELHE